MESSSCFPVQHFRDVGRAFVNPTKSSHERSRHPLIENSRTFAPPNSISRAGIGHARRPFSAAQGTHAGCHLIPNCSGLRRNRSRGNVHQSCADAETCMLKTGGLAKCAKVVSLPTWSSSEEAGRLGQAYEC